MTCKNHPSVEAVDRCAGCAEAFCANCLVDMGGKKYCAECKGMALKPGVIPEAATIECQLANEALKYAIISIFCFGVILGPMAISKALKAKKEIEADPILSGSGKANAALIIGIAALALWIIGIIARIIESSS